MRELPAEERRALRQDKTKPVADALYQWLAQQRQLVPDGSATAKAIDYSLKRWKALVRFIDDGELPIDITGSRTRSDRSQWPVHSAPPC